MHFFGANEIGSAGTEHFQGDVDSTKYLAKKSIPSSDATIYREEVRYRSMLVGNQ
jgi:hypothetical protein